MQKKTTMIVEMALIAKSMKNSIKETKLSKWMSCLDKKKIKLGAEMKGKLWIQKFIYAGMAIYKPFEIIFQ